MNLIIIEDEKPAAEKLHKAVLELDAGIRVLSVLGSVCSSIRWFQQNPVPDLILMDVELSDGLSFRILEQCPVSCPVIFTTAYDEYWMESFEYNSIDYLLKPIRREKLESALQKYKKLEQHFSSSYPALLSPVPATAIPAAYRKRFLVKKGIDLIAVRTSEIAYCYAAHKLSFIVDEKGHQFILDKSLTDLEKELDPALFFRANRKFLISIHHIKRISHFSRSKLMLELNPPASEEVLVSQENAAAFKKWMDT